MERIEGYDSWKLASPDYYEVEPKRCEGCDSEIDEVIEDETEFCEDCLCGYDDDDESSECEGCVYCMCCKDYDEAKADGTLQPHFS